MINNVNTITNVYAANANKQNGSTLEAQEWNDISSAVNTAHQKINLIIQNGISEVPEQQGGSSSSDSGVVSVNDKGNTVISSSKHINIEPTYDANGSSEGTYGDVQIKPGDDITLESHHRATNKRDEITIKTSNGQSGNSKAPVKLLLIAADMTLSSKGKTGDDSNVMNVNVTTGEGKGYLKVRAQAIDLRCEDHGGIALQPKGEDSDHHMNKIKFEHGGGDGLEFGTFNAEKTSIFTDEYRFNKDGVWKSAKRVKIDSDKANENDRTTLYKYLKNDDQEVTDQLSLEDGVVYNSPDDFYDFINTNDPVASTDSIIKTANAFNYNNNVSTNFDSSNASLKIESNDSFIVYQSLPLESQSLDSSAQVVNVNTTVRLDELFSAPYEKFVNGKEYSLNELLNIIYSITNITNEQKSSLEDEMKDGSTAVIRLVGIHEESAIGGDDIIYLFRITNGGIKLSGRKVKLSGELDFGSTFNFGETDNGIEVQYKLTKKNAKKDCGIIKVVGVNNHTSNNLTVDGWDSQNNAITTYTIAPGNTQTLAECSLLDVILLTNYMKTHQEGPWATQL